MGGPRGMFPATRRMTSQADARGTGTWRPWRKAHGLTAAWAAGCLAAWIGTILVAAVSVPLKYPYEAAGTIIDSASVVGLLVPVAVVGLCLREGPRHLVLGAARPLWPQRLALALACSTAVFAGAWTLALLADLPTTVVLLDAQLYFALLLVSTSLWGVALGWVTPLALALLMSAPGLIPWQWNFLYNQDVTLERWAAVAAVLAVGLSAYAWRGSVERFTFGDRD